MSRYDFAIIKSKLCVYSVLKITMQATDRREKEKADAKNSVEEYVYEMREKLSDQLAEFVDEQVRDSSLLLVRAGGQQKLFTLNYFI